MLNERANKILAFIRSFTRDNGYPPTIREIGESFGISSTNGVRYYLNLLERGGHLKRSGRISRGIGPTTPMASPGIPILGRVAAGQPILAEENHEGTLEAEQMFGDRRGLFALKVRGDSMVDAGILEGDYVIVRHQENANAGEIIVALVADEATVKYYRPREDSVELVPANAKYEPIVVAEESDFRILGIVRGVLRTIGR
ncbi:MAG TPA: transcriptional repressor LexA [Candidatus Eisenbacteria bacterium]|nr:transcriptional repressor LexA [Candidatus Eisenbacteria bacterium]